MEKNKTEIGRQRMVEVMGSRANSILAKFNQESPGFEKYLLEFCWGDIYMRSGLDDKTRLVAAFSFFIGQGNVGGIIFKRYVRTMLNIGWSKHEITEIIILSTVYVGFPIAGEALDTVNQVFAEDDFKNVK